MSPPRAFVPPRLSELRFWDLRDQRKLTCQICTTVYPPGEIRCFSTVFYFGNRLNGGYFQKISACGGLLDVKMHCLARRRREIFENRLLEGHFAFENRDLGRR